MQCLDVVNHERSSGEEGMLRSNKCCHYLSRLLARQVDEIVMIAEDILGRVLTCMGQKDDTVAKGLLAGKVRKYSVSHLFILLFIVYFTFYCFGSTPCRTFFFSSYSFVEARTYHTKKNGIFLILQ